MLSLSHLSCLLNSTLPLFFLISLFSFLPFNLPPFTCLSFRSRGYNPMQQLRHKVHTPVFSAVACVWQIVRKRKIKKIERGRRENELFWPGIMSFVLDVSMNTGISFISLRDLFGRTSFSSTWKVQFFLLPFADVYRHMLQGAGFYCIRINRLPSCLIRLTLSLYLFLFDRPVYNDGVCLSCTKDQFTIMNIERMMTEKKGN